MSDHLQHECGIAVVRLRKPLQYYYDKYGTALYGFQKLFLLMEKQHNRGQDGMGVGCCKLDMNLGQPYMFRMRNAKSDALARSFREQMKVYYKLADKGILDPKDPESVKTHFDFGGEVLMGHLRYGTSGVFQAGACHPYLRRSNWPTKTLMVLGNFNMTNARDLNHHLIERGQHPVFQTDTQTVLEEIGYHLDEEHTDLYRMLRDQGCPGKEIPQTISRDLNISNIIAKSSKIWDGGYTIAGAVGNGDAFVLRDPNGIRPCFYCVTDEFYAFASERVPLLTVFGLDQSQVQEMPPAHMAVMKNEGGFQLEQYAEPEGGGKKACSFERIYFSRGNDPEIYKERKKLGESLVPQIVKEVKGNFHSSIFSFIPNTAETAYHGMMEGLRLHRRQEVKKELLEKAKEGALDEASLDELIMGNWPRGEKIAHKDIKLRTFISQEENRDQLVSHVYDITYGVVSPEDQLVVLDDSIVRGTTLKKSILSILARTNPKKIIIASTAPQIRYPDCYGIDMAELGKFIAFQAAVDLLRERNMQGVLVDTYAQCQSALASEEVVKENFVKNIYEPFSPEEVSAKIAQLVRPMDVSWKGDLSVIFQDIEQLHSSCPNHQGDWYFTGDYPTDGGYQVVNRAFVHYYEKRKGRPYDLWF